MADEKNTNQGSSSDEAKAVQAGTRPPRGDVPEQRNARDQERTTLKAIRCIFRRLQWTVTSYARTYAQLCQNLSTPPAACSLVYAG